MHRERERLGSPHPCSCRADMSRGALARCAVSCVSVGLRVASGAGMMAVRVVGTDQGWWQGQTDHAHGHQEMESSGSAWTWQEMAGTD